MSGDDNSRVLERAKQAWNREKGREKARQKSPSYWQSVVRRGGLRKRGLERERDPRGRSSTNRSDCRAALLIRLLHRWAQTVGLIDAMTRSNEFRRSDNPHSDRILSPTCWKSDDTSRIGGWFEDESWSSCVHQSLTKRKKKELHRR